MMASFSSIRLRLSLKKSMRIGQVARYLFLHGRSSVILREVFFFSSFVMIYIYHWDFKSSDLFTHFTHQRFTGHLIDAQHRARGYRSS